VDLERLAIMLKATHPALIYIDQATFLFAIDPLPIRSLVDALSLQTVIHYDSSHINGLIFGGALFNPLERGAHCFGGSTHKTLPGPHKGFLATHDADLAARIEEKANCFVSHHHPSSAVSLTITLMEMKWCDGHRYAQRVVSNTQYFARLLAECDFHVAAEERGYTNCHQVWAYPHQAHQIDPLFEVLRETGVYTNLFSSLPGISQPALRLSMAEVTRLGATKDDVALIAEIFSLALHFPDHKSRIQSHMRTLNRRLAKAQFCFDLADIKRTALSEPIRHLFEALCSYAGDHLS